MKKYLQLIFCFTFISCGSGDDESLTPVCPFTVEIIGLDADVCVGQSGTRVLMGRPKEVYPCRHGPRRIGESGVATGARLRFDMFPHAHRQLATWGA